MKNYMKTIISSIQNWTLDKINEIYNRFNEINERFKAADWEQNDSTADDYIKNKPFYENVIELGDSITLNKNGSSYIASYGSDSYNIYCDLYDENDINTIRINDVSYLVEKDLTSNQTRILMYNGSIVICRSEEGDLFLDPNILGIDTTLESYTVELLCLNKELKTLDEKFIPDSIQRVEDMSSINLSHFNNDLQGTLIGKSGTGENSEIFNDYENNIASGDYSHAEGYNTVAKYAHMSTSGTFNAFDESAHEYIIDNYDYSLDFSIINQDSAYGKCSYAESYEIVDGKYHLNNATLNVDLDKLPIGCYFYTLWNYGSSSGIVTKNKEIYKLISLTPLIVSKHVLTEPNGVDKCKYIKVIGNGKKELNRSNAHTLDWSGNAEFSGDVIAYGCERIGETPISLKTVSEKVDNISWNDLEDKPFYDTRKEVTTPLQTINGTTVGGYLKVADEIDFDITTVEHLYRNSTTDGEEFSGQIKAIQDCGYDVFAFDLVHRSVDSEEWLGVYFDSQWDADRWHGDSENNPFTKGLYMWVDVGDSMEANITYSLTYRDVNDGELKPLDEKYIGETVYNIAQNVIYQEINHLYENIGETFNNIEESFIDVNNSITDLDGLIAENKEAIDEVNNKIDNFEIPEPVTSWNDLEDRPFYVGDATFVDVYNGTCTFELDEYMGLYMCTLENQSIDLSDGDEVKVNWDGTDYECVVSNVDGGLIIGNKSLVDYGEDTEEPFIFNYIPAPKIMMLATSSTESTHTVTISKKNQPIIKLDNKYLDSPLMVAHIVGETVDKTYEEMQSHIANNGHIVLISEDGRDVYQSTRNYPEFNYIEFAWVNVSSLTGDPSVTRNIIEVKSNNTIKHRNYSFSPSSTVNALNTTDKTIAGAINELNEKVNESDNFIVNISMVAPANIEYKPAADKTFAEILEAINNGKNVLAKLNDNSLILTLFMYSENGIVFTGNMTTPEGSLNSITIVIYSNDTIDMPMNNFNIGLDELTTENKTITGAINEVNEKASAHVSWNDLTDRPFYTTEPTETAILDQTVEEFLEWEGIYDSVATLNQPLILEQSYTVVWDGVTYENVVCVECYEGGEPYPCLGAHDDDYSTYPFKIRADGVYAILRTNSTNTSHTVKITTMLSTLVQLPEEFISYKPGLKTDVEGGEIFNDYENNIATGEYSTAQGYQTKATATASSAEGYQTEATGAYSHAEGEDTKASARSAHSEGAGTVARGLYSHAEGVYTIASRRSQHVEGEYNIADTSGDYTASKGKYIKVVGNGTSEEERSNAHTLDWDGNAWFSGDVIVGGTSQDDGKKLATEEYVNNKLTSALDHVVLADQSTGTNYKLYIVDGKLTIEEVA